MTMGELLATELAHIVNALPVGMTLDDWYSDEMMSFEVFGDMDDIQREAVSYAVGYLRGAADARDMTVMELLQHEGVKPASVKTRALKSARKAKR